LSQEQIARISDLQVPIIVRNDNDFPAVMFHRGHFVGHRQVVCSDRLIRGPEKAGLENLWRLHREKSFARDSPSHETFFIRAFKRVGHRLRQSRGAVLLSRAQNSCNLVRGNQRPGRIMHCHVIGLAGHSLQAAADGILPLFPADDHLHDFPEAGLADEFLELTNPVAPSDDDNLIDAIRVLKGQEGVSDDRFIVKQGEQLIEAHPLAATGSDNDGAQHEE